MMMKRNVILAMVFGLALSACATTSEKQLRAQGMEPLSQAELEALFDGTVHPHWKIPTGATGSSVFREDGTATVNWGTGSSAGTYRLTGGEFCTTWQKLHGGREVCGTLYRTGDGEFMRYIDGKLNSTWWFKN